MNAERQRKPKFKVGQVVYLENGTGASYGRITHKWPVAVVALQIVWNYKVYRYDGLDTLSFAENSLRQLTKREAGR